ncbi:MAG: photosynthetic reaction center subunit H [Pseudomonadota bacterium]
MVGFTEYIDAAQVVLYAFWIFFAGLIYYLRREDKREGYPLESDRNARTSRVKVVGFPAPPEPKTYRLPNGQGDRTAPHAETITGEIPGAKPVAPWFGAPLAPTGDPMVDGVGPASYPQRDDVPDLAASGLPRVIPMRLAEGFDVEHKDPDPRGFSIKAADGQIVGEVVELWVDRSEPRILFYEIKLAADYAGDSTTNALLPYGFAVVKFRRRQINVASLMGKHFRTVPRTASMDQITRLEEDRITAYYSSGHLYAHPSRSEPLI